MIIASIYNQIPNEKLGRKVCFPTTLTIPLALKIQSRKEDIVRAILAVDKTNNLGKYAKNRALETVYKLYGTEPNGVRFISLNSNDHWAEFGRIIPLGAIYFYDQGEFRAYLFGQHHLQTPIELVLPFDKKPQLKEQREYVSLALFFGLMKVFDVTDVRGVNALKVKNLLRRLSPEGDQ